MIRGPKGFSTQLTSISFAIQRNFYIGKPFGNEIIEVRSAWSARAFKNEWRSFEIVFRCSSKGNIRCYPPIKLIGCGVVLPGERCNSKTCFFQLVACDFSATQHFFPLERQQFRTKILLLSRAAFPFLPITLIGLQVCYISSTLVLEM